MTTKKEIREKFEASEYPIQLIGRHEELTDAMKNYAIEKLTKVERYGVDCIDAHVIIDHQRFFHTVEYVILAGKLKVRVIATDADYYAAVDCAAKKLQSKLERYHERLKEHHHKGVSEIELSMQLVKGSELAEINDQIEEENFSRLEEVFTPGEIVEKHASKLKTLTVQEAIMKMDLSEDPFLVYRSEEDLTIKVLYRRDGKDYGLLELPL